jgi:hypothetical protein
VILTVLNVFRFNDIVFFIYYKNKQEDNEVQYAGLFIEIHVLKKYGKYGEMLQEV